MEDQFNLIVTRGEEHQEVACDGYVLITWNEADNGAAAASLFASKPVDDNEADLLMAARLIARSLQERKDTAAEIVGKVIEKALDQTISKMKVHMQADTAKP